MPEDLEPMMQPGVPEHQPQMIYEIFGAIGVTLVTVGFLTICMLIAWLLT